jgi:hypothetical protein
MELAKGLKPLARGRETTQQVRGQGALAPWRLAWVSQLTPLVRSTGLPTYEHSRRGFPRS